ncbi:killer toxin [Teratosphaeria destructans]|uniref:Killer toxin n=1 Tax=Teratosphaeria destructans TaxID=418781 RepID=A0A9W7W4U1_9PEZI|nr:killer toxin [Teratosphaeria destructans]
MKISGVPFRKDLVLSKMHAPFFLPLLLSSLILAGSKGLNCQGSSACGSFSTDHGAVFDAIDIISGYIESLDDGLARSEVDGHIACWDVSSNVLNGGVCAFIQKTSDEFTGAQIKALMAELSNHCGGNCGSIPTGYLDGDNNVYNGELTVNYVSKPKGCNGICSGWLGP